MGSCEIGGSKARIRMLLLVGALITLIPFLVDLNSGWQIIAYVLLAGAFIAAAARYCPMCKQIGKAVRG